MNDKTKSDDCIVRVRFVESPEKYNYRWSIMQDVLLPIPLPHLEPIQECACNARTVQLLTQDTYFPITFYN